MFEQQKDLRAHVRDFASRVADQIAAQEKMARQSADSGRLCGNRIVEFEYAADVVKNRSRQEEIAVQRRLQFGIMGNIAIREHETALRDRQGMFQPAGGEREKVFLRGGNALQAFGVTVQGEQHQFPQQLVAKLGLDQGPEFREHRFGVESGSFDELQWVESFCPVGINRETDLFDVDLWTVSVVLAVIRADLEELPVFPFALAGVKEFAVGPNHVGGRAAGVAKATGVIRR